MGDPEDPMENGRQYKAALQLDVIAGEIPRYTDPGNDPEYCRYKKRLFWNQYKKREAYGSNRDQRAPEAMLVLPGCQDCD